MAVPTQIAANPPAPTTSPEPVVVGRPPVPRAPRPLPRVVWWRELLLAATGYLVYAQARTLNGSGITESDTAVAERNGRAIWDLERALGLDWEHGLQSVFLPHEGFLKVVGGFYGGAHFAVTFGVLLWLLFRRPEQYRFWRTVLFATTMIAVAIFAAFPAAPPRLLPPGERTVDTLFEIGGLWSYNDGVLERISDPYAPLPSLHLGWAAWVTAVLLVAVPVRTWRARLLVLVYPAAVYFAIIVTGTHYVIDGVAGIALLVVVAFALAGVARHRTRRRQRSAGLQAEPRAPVDEVVEPEAVDRAVRAGR